MHKEMFQKFIYLGLLLIFGFLFVQSPSNAFAYEHDLKVRGIVPKVTDDCRIKITVAILVKGTEDDIIGDPGEPIPFIQIYYKKSGEDWQVNGSIDIVRGELDSGFVPYAQWPDEFNSNPTNWTFFDPPCDGEYWFKARIFYDRDQNPGNNERESSSVSVTCAGECSPLYTEYTAKTAALKALEYAMRAGIIGWRTCEEYPWLCPGQDICDLDPRLCHVRGEVEILFDNSINHLKLAVITKSGIIISKMEQLKKPIIVEDIKYNQRLKFYKSKDMVYRLTYWPTKETRVTEKLPFPILIRPLKQKSK